MFHDVVTYRHMPVAFSQMWGDYQVRYGHVSYDAPSVVGFDFKHPQHLCPPLNILNSALLGSVRIEIQSLTVPH